MSSVDYAGQIAELRRELAELRPIADQLACQKLQQRYWYGQAKRDPDIVCSVFTDDARFGQIHGLDRIRAQTEMYMAHMGPVLESHHIIPVVADIHVDGDHARGEVRGVAFMRMRAADGSENVTVLGIGYLDEFVRTPDGWRISAMRGIESGFAAPHDTTWRFEAVSANAPAPFPDP